MKRDSWTEYLLSLADSVRSRATCTRKKVGIVIAKDNRILATGYNGSISGEDHCTDEGCLMYNGHCIRTVHAEVNAIAQAAKHGHSIDGATAYVTLEPCWDCYKMMVNAGISSIFYSEEYLDPRYKEFAFLPIVPKYYPLSSKQ